MSWRLVAFACSIGVLACAGVAFTAVSSESTQYNSYRLLGISMSSAFVLALIGLLHRSWARIALLAAAVPAGLLAFDWLAPQGDGGDAEIDLTPVLFPPAICLFAAIAVFVLAIERSRDRQRA
jgi:hypothetical protein